ncbi:hypothetical protein BC831DRAFT_466643 [Entophlyctis helioformis]|nr:hypothetical protein BC831DRAFT_466643 [Entophlyctis helioformis]
MRRVFVVAVWSLCVSWASAAVPVPSRPECSTSSSGAEPPSVECLARSADLTVLATILSHGREVDDTGNAQYYNATLSINCVWAVFGGAPATDNLTGLAGSTIQVANWGAYSGTLCPGGAAGSRAVDGQTRMVFLEIIAAPVQGQRLSQALFSLRDVCAGTLEATPFTLLDLAGLLEQNPANAVDALFIGDPTCTLIDMTGVVPTATTATTATTTIPPITTTSSAQQASWTTSDAVLSSTSETSLFPTQSTQTTDAPTAISSTTMASSSSSLGLLDTSPSPVQTNDQTLVPVPVPIPSQQPGRISPGGRQNTTGNLGQGTASDGAPVGTIAGIIAAMVGVGVTAYVAFHVAKLASTPVRKRIIMFTTSDEHLDILATSTSHNGGQSSHDGGGQKRETQHPSPKASPLPRPTRHAPYASFPQSSAVAAAPLVQDSRLQYHTTAEMHQQPISQPYNWSYTQTEQGAYTHTLPNGNFQPQMPYYTSNQLEDGSMQADQHNQARYNPGQFNYGNQQGNEDGQYSQYQPSQRDQYERH